MINVKPMDGCDWHWTGLHTEGHAPEPQVWLAPAERVSALLGPDGEPLHVGYERPRMGFDLTPKGGRK